MRYLLDTNHLSHALRVDSPVRERIFQKRREGNRLATCWPVLCELEDGLVQLADDKRHRRMLAVLLGEVRIWPDDREVVQHFGFFSQLARKRGRVLSHVDRVLAAMAWKSGAILLSADKDFGPFPEIRTENWIVTP